MAGFFCLPAVRDDDGCGGMIPSQVTTEERQAARMGVTEAAAAASVLQHNGLRQAGYAANRGFWELAVCRRKKAKSPAVAVDRPAVPHRQRAGAVSVQWREKRSSDSHTHTHGPLSVSPAQTAWHQCCFQVCTATHPPRLPRPPQRAPLTSVTAPTHFPEPLPAAASAGSKPVCSRERLSGGS